MHEEKVHFRWLIDSNNNDLQLPQYQSDKAAGMDVQAAIDREIIIDPGRIAIISTGFAIALPAGYEMQVRPRSGLAFHFGITIINSPGTIDEDYRGEVKIALINLGDKPYSVKRGDRIAQLVLAPVVRAKLVVTDILQSTSRSDGGFGHTGI